MDTLEASHEFVMKQLADVLKKCERKKIDPEVVVQTALSFAATLAVACLDQEGAAELIESLAEAIRSGEMTVSEE